MHLFLHLSVSAFLLFRISVFLHFYMSTTLSIAYVMHFCISAFLHCSSASILDLFSHAKMRVFCIFGFPHFCISVFLSFCMLPDVRPQSFVNVRCFVLIFEDVRRLSQICISALLLSFCNDPIGIRRGSLGRNHKAKEEATYR